MSGSLSFHSQLSSIMETLARAALTQVCRLVDEDSAELRLQVSRLLVANSVLTEKVNSLESRRTTVRSVGVQAVCHRDGDTYGTFVSPVTIRSEVVTSIVSVFTGVFVLLLFFSYLLLLFSVRASSHHRGDLWEGLVHGSVERQRPLQPGD